MLIGQIFIELQSLTNDAILPISADALRCWRCSSDTSNGGFCKDPFTPSLMSEAQRKWNYVDCALPSDINPSLINQARPVCKKIIQQGGGVVELRDCLVTVGCLSYFSWREDCVCPRLFLGTGRSCFGCL